MWSRPSLDERSRASLFATSAGRYVTSLLKPAGLPGAGLLPHIRQFARGRQTPVGAKALNASVTDLPQKSWGGVILLERRADKRLGRLLGHLGLVRAAQWGWNIPQRPHAVG